MTVVASLLSSELGQTFITFYVSCCGVLPVIVITIDVFDPLMTLLTSISGVIVRASYPYIKTDDL